MWHPRLGERRSRRKRAAGVACPILVEGKFRFGARSRSQLLTETRQLFFFCDQHPLFARADVEKEGTVGA